MTNTEVPTVVPQAAIYFKPRYQLAKFTTPIAEDNPAGVWREWTNPRTNEPGKTYELQVDKIQGKFVDARIKTQEFQNDDGSVRKETSLLLALEEYGTTRVLKLSVKHKGELSSEFKYFAKRCEMIDPKLKTFFELWKPPSSDRAVLLYKQDLGLKWPQTRKDCYTWDESKGDYSDLPAPTVTTKLGEEVKDYTKRDEYLYGVVEKFCEKVQSLNSQEQPESASSEDVEEDVPMNF